MPTYRYHCPANDTVVTVLHGMDTTLRTWGEVCASAGMDENGTPANAPVARQIGAGVLLRAGQGKAAKGGCCPGCH
jgi:predicted nucleic acid-binding Zn ribbon protein